MIARQFPLKTEIKRSRRVRVQHMKLLLRLQISRVWLGLANQANIWVWAIINLCRTTRPIWVTARTFLISKWIILIAILSLLISIEILFQAVRRCSLLATLKTCYNLTIIQLVRELRALTVSELEKSIWVCARPIIHLRRNYREVLVPFHKHFW